MSGKAAMRSAASAMSIFMKICWINSVGKPGSRVKKPRNTAVNMKRGCCSVKPVQGRRRPCRGAAQPRRLRRRPMVLLVPAEAPIHAGKAAVDIRSQGLKPISTKRSAMSTAPSLLWALILCQTNAIRALDWYFSSHTAETAATVLARLTCIKSELQDTLTNSRFGCHPGHHGRAIAYVCVGSTTPCQSTHTNVCLTDRYFGKSDRVRAEVLIHECGHRAGLSAGSPDIYDFTWQFMFMDTADSLMNTDSYALFAPALTEGVRTTMYGFPYLVGLSAGSAVPGTGESTWQARLYFGTEFQNPVLGVFNPTIGIGLSLIGETSTGGTSAITSPPSFLASLVGGFRLTDPRPGSAGSGYASFFGGPAIVVPFPAAGSSGDVRIGADAGMAIGYRWRWLDVSVGVNYAYDPTRKAGMEHLFIPNLSITFAPEFTQFPSSH